MRTASTNSELVQLLNEIADLLDLGGEKFKPDAYRRAARSIESLTEDIRAVSDRGQLETIPGVGAAIGEKVREYLKDGRIHYVDRLRTQYPAGLRELMQRPGIGPKTTRRFLVELGVEGPAELAAAIDAGRLNGLKGFGPRKIELLRAAVSAGAAPVARSPLKQAFAIASRLVAHLRANAPLLSIEVAGSLRRRREDVGDIDILVTSEEPEKVFDAFTAFPGRRETRLRGPTKETILVEGGTQVDLRVVEPGEFGAALQYFTGSKDHNVVLRTRAKDRGLKVNEYGVFRGDERVAGATEPEVYQSLGLAWIPPEIRENAGEVEAAEKGTLPTLVALEDLRGDLHVHAPVRPDPVWLDRTVDSARARRLAYVGLLLPAEGAAQAAEWRTALDARRPSGIRFHLGTEADRPPAPELGLEFWVASGALNADPDPHPPALLAHLTARGPEAEAPLRLARERGVPLDVGPDGPDASLLRRHIGSGGKLHLSVLVDEDGVDLGELGTGFARRAWATPGAVINCEPAAEVPSARGPAARSSPRRH